MEEPPVEKAEVAEQDTSPQEVQAKEEKETPTTTMEEEQPVEKAEQESVQEVQAKEEKETPLPSVELENVEEDVGIPAQVTPPSPVEEPQEPMGTTDTPSPPREKDEKSIEHTSPKAEVEPIREEEMSEEEVSVNVEEDMSEHEHDTSMEVEHSEGEEVEIEDREEEKVHDTSVDEGQLDSSRPSVDIKLDDSAEEEEETKHLEYEGEHFHHVAEEEQSVEEEEEVKVEAPTLGILCDDCGEGDPLPEWHCAACGYLCADCAQSHRRRKATRDHEGRPAADARALDLQGPAPCANHPDKRATVLCTGCKWTFLCAACALSSEHDGHRRIPAEDVVSKCQDDLEHAQTVIGEATVATSTALDGVLSAEAEINSVADEAMNACRRVFAVAAGAIERRRARLMTMIEEERAARTSALRKQQEALEEQAQALQRRHQGVEKALKSGGVSHEITGITEQSGEEVELQPMANHLSFEFRDSEREELAEEEEEEEVLAPLERFPSQVALLPKQAEETVEHTKIAKRLRMRGLPYGEAKKVWGWAKEYEAWRSSVQAEKEEEEEEVKETIDGGGPWPLPLRIRDPGISYWNAWDVSEGASGALVAVLNAVSVLGYVHTGPDAEMCICHGPGLEKSIVGEDAVIDVVSRDRRGVNCRTGGATVRAWLEKQGCAEDKGETESLADIRLDDLKNGTYRVTYRAWPNASGTCLLHITLSGKPVRDAPFSIAICAPNASARRDPMSLGPILQVFGSVGAEKAQFFEFPRGIATDAGSRIFVADTHNNVVQVFSPDGQFVRTLGDGEYAGKISNPCDVAVGPKGHVVLADHGSHAIHVFSAEGKLLQTWNRAGKSRDGLGIPLKGPEGVCVDSRNNVIVADGPSGRVFVFSMKGKLLGRIGSRGKGLGEFRVPTAVAVCPASGRIAVGDFKLNRIQIFAPGGKADVVIIYLPAAPSALGGLAFSPEGRLFVVDCGRHRVMVYSRAGVLLHAFGGRGREPGQLLHPWGCCVQPGTGLLCVADGANHRISCF